MREIGRAGNLIYSILDQDSTSYILCDIGSNRYIFLSPKRKETVAPTTDSERICWTCRDKTNSGVLHYSALIDSEKIHQKQFTHLCQDCSDKVLFGWYKFKEIAIPKTVSCQI